MIQEYKSDKGFKILKLSKLTDALELFEGGLSICDSCNLASYSGYYIAVLNRFYCESCFTEWHNRATYYKEDAGFEQRNYDFYLKKATELGLLQEGIDFANLPKDLAEMKEALGDELCSYCSWKEEPHHPTDLCEGNYCDEALEDFMEENKEYFI